MTGHPKSFLFFGEKFLLLVNTGFSYSKLHTRLHSVVLYSLLFCSPYISVTYNYQMYRPICLLYNDMWCKYKTDLVGITLPNMARGAEQPLVMNSIFINPQTSAALVDWGETHQRKVHRVGYNGKVELSVHIIILSVVYLIRLCS